MKNSIKEDILIVINGFAVAYLFIHTQLDTFDCICAALAMLTFLSYGKINKS